MAKPYEKQHSNPEITHKAVQEDRKKTNEYAMERKPRGNCVIINNEKLETMDNRSGTEFDAENLQKTFMWLQFDVDIFNDCTADSICNHIVEYSETTNALYHVS